MRDPRFSDTTILLTDYGPEGAVGLVINRPTDLRLSEEYPGVSGLDERSDAVYWGGPVNTNMLFILFRSKEPVEGAVHVSGGVYVSASPNLLHNLLMGERGVGEMRVFAGYAGWAPGQLETEVSLGAWTVTESTPEDIFSGVHGDLWTGLGR